MHLTCEESCRYSFFRWALHQNKREPSKVAQRVSLRTEGPGFQTEMSNTLNYRTITIWSQKIANLNLSCKKKKKWNCGNNFGTHRTFENVINKLWNQGDKNQMTQGGIAMPPAQPLTLSHAEWGFHAASPGGRGSRANACLLLRTPPRAAAFGKHGMREFASSEAGLTGVWQPRTWKWAPQKPMFL